MQIFPIGAGGIQQMGVFPAAQHTMNSALSPQIGRQDKVNISPQGKLAAVLEGFQKQREAVIEQKSELVAKAMESGKGMESIEEPLALLDEKLENLEILRDQTIADYNERMMREAAQKKEEKNERAEAKDAVENPEAKNIKALNDVATGFEQAKVVRSAGRKLDGEARVAEREAQQDGFLLEARRIRNQGKLGTAERAFLNGAIGAAKARGIEAQAAQRQAGDMQSLANGKLAETGEKARELNGENGEKEKEEEKAHEGAADAAQQVQA